MVKWLEKLLFYQDDEIIKLANKYCLIPDNHHSPKWYKIVIMDHFTIEKLMPLVEN